MDSEEKTTAREKAQEQVKALKAVGYTKPGGYSFSGGGRSSVNSGRTGGGSGSQRQKSSGRKR